MKALHESPLLGKLSWMSFDFVKSEKRQQVFELRMQGLTLEKIADACNCPLQETAELLAEAVKIICRKCDLTFTELDALDIQKIRLDIEDMPHVPIDFLETEAIDWDFTSESEHLDLG